ncbi:uncharacterized protein LOC129910367 [Episyrphus balteatus]|uniref:uncharacterized protein LOC129910367 n=1 Tax=Episyrphus balteatus TaxID=286459 RepID=UPI002486A9DC|nr:uncharacterized protein LOC129910367 [Episyrphus balteatus]
MMLLSIFIVWLQLYGVLAGYFEITQLIEKVHNLSDSAAVYFVGVEDEFLADFMKTHSSIPISIFSSISSDFIYFTNTILVFQDPANVNVKNTSLLITKLLVRKFVIVIASNINTLNQYFFYFKEHNFTRIFGVSGDISYAFLPYAKIQIQQLIRTDPFPDAMKDLNGFVFRTAIQKDVPRTIQYPDKNGQNRIGGSLAPVFVEFLKRFNAKFEEILINNSSELNMPGLFNATINHEIDISMNTYLPHEGLELSYPITVLDYVIMVPRNGYLDPYDYFQRPFSVTVWLCIGLTLLYITIIKVILDICQGNSDHWSCFSETFLNFLNLPTERPITFAYRLHFLVLIFSFVIGQLYNIYFTSFLTVYIPIKQFDTVQDMVDKNLQLLMADYEFDRRPNFYPAGLANLIVPISHTVQLPQMYSMRNTSYAYALGEDRCQFLVQWQITLIGRSLFRRARQSIKFYYLGFLLAFHSPFKEILNNFIIEIQQTGLLKKWNSETVCQAKQMGFSLNVTRNDNVQDMNV